MRGGRRVGPFGGWPSFSFALDWLPHPARFSQAGRSGQRWVLRSSILGPVSIHYSAEAKFDAVKGREMEKACDVPRRLSCGFAEVKTGTAGRIVPTLRKSRRVGQPVVYSLPKKGWASPQGSKDEAPKILVAYNKLKARARPPGGIPGWGDRHAEERTLAPQPYGPGFAAFMPVMTASCIWR